MSLPLNKLELDYPNYIETHLDYGLSTVACFNRKGTLLAAGTTNGQIVIWDFETRSVAKVLQHEAEIFTQEITALSWSSNGYFVLSGSSAGWVVRWDVLSGKPIEQWLCPDEGKDKKKKGIPIASVQMHPKNPAIWLVNTESLKPMLISHEHTKPLTPTAKTSPTPDEDGKEKEGVEETSPPVWPSTSQGTCVELVNLPALEEPDPTAEHAVAVFDKTGTQIYAGSNRGCVTILNSTDLMPISWFSVGSRHKIRELVFSPDGTLLLANCVDKTLRSFDVETKELVTEARDSVNGLHWRTCCFSGNSELIIGAAKINDKQHIYIWNRYGQLLTFLVGPNQALMHLAYHPTQTVIAAVGSSGLIFIWQKRQLENWSAFATDFVELENNEEYIEREDEFDIIVEEPKKEVDEDFVDVMGGDDGNSNSSTHNTEEEKELTYLPVVPRRNCFDPNLGPRTEAEELSANNKRGRAECPATPPRNSAKSRKK